MPRKRNLTEPQRFPDFSFSYQHAHLFAVVERLRDVHHVDVIVLLGGLRGGC
ncbi:hypothetical protein BC829DRAFT_380480, partial [Chytridium lagenaria]